MTDPRPPHRGVLDDAWEQELAAGQDAVGEHGDLDADLAMVHLLRHARAPEVLGEDALEEVLGQVQAAHKGGATRWWRHRMIRWVALPACASLTIALFIRSEDEAEDTVAMVTSEVEHGPQDAPAKVAAAEQERDAPRKPYELQFAALEGRARATLRDSVVTSRLEARHDWLASLGATAKAGGEGGDDDRRGGVR